MARVLGGIKGRFILSIKLPPIRRAFECFRLRPVRLSYTLAGNDNAKAARELVITGRR